MKLDTPRQLSARFDRGEIDRDEFRKLMAFHARELIAEIEEEHRNPLAAWIESRLAKAAVKRLLRKHTPFQIREILVALSEAPGCPMANHLWNCAHPDVPLHCFFRIRKEPVFRIISIKSEGNRTGIHIEILRLRNRQRITLVRDAAWQLRAPSFPIASGRG